MWEMLDSAGASPSITVVAGSPRDISFSARLSRHIVALLTDVMGVSGVELLDLGRTHPPPWSEELSRREPESWEGWKPIARVLEQSDGFVFVVPEWGGMAPPALKNLFLLCDGTLELADKPGLLVGVSSGHGGASPLAELRISSYKNARVCYIPEQIIVREVEDLFIGDTFLESPEAKRLESRLLHALRLLVGYAGALAIVRDAGLRDPGQFQWNMS